MKIITTSALLLAVLFFPAFAQDFSITEETFSSELSGLAALSVNSIPEVAAVYIDGIYSGNTDTVLPLPPDGPHKIELKKPGYENLIINFSADKNTGLEINAELRQWTGILRIETIPDDALITADGTILSQGPHTLPSGSYTIIISRDGWKPWVDTIRIFNEDEKTLSIELTRTDDADETSSAQDETIPAEYPFAFRSTLGTGLLLCPEPGTLPEAEFQFSTKFSYKNAEFPFEAGIRAAPIQNLELSAAIQSYLAVGFIGDTSLGAGASIKYSLACSSDSGFNAAATLSGMIMSTSSGSAHNNSNCISLAIPVEIIIPIENIKTGLTISPGLKGSFYLSDGTGVSIPALKLMTPAGIWLKGSDFRLGLSAAPDYPEFGYGFPGITGISAGLEAGLRIPGTSSAFSIFGRIDPSGIEAGAAVSFISF